MPRNDVLQVEINRGQIPDWIAMFHLEAVKGAADKYTAGRAATFILRAEDLPFLPNRCDEIDQLVLVYGGKE